MDAKKSLSSSEWGKIYNKGIVDNVVKDLKNNHISFQTKEMLKLSVEGEKILEIGCGSGATSVCLAHHNRRVTSLDFSEESIECVKAVAGEIGCSLSVLKADATIRLPFQEKEFDIVFQAGLLEHFEREQRIKLLKNWKLVTKKMISIIPNANSLAYKYGKEVMEKKNEWPYGLELPQYTMKDEFIESGIMVEREYTVGAEHALEFLPQKNYLRKALYRWMKENENFEDYGQGYLLVTVGACK